MASKMWVPAVKCVVSLIMRYTAEITKRRKELRHGENKVCFLQDRFVADLAVRIQFPSL